jgi:hypothetical protein
VKLIAHFDKFLVDEVNLNKTRIKTLTDRVVTIERFIQGSDWRLRVLRFSPQGSWAHKTINTPDTYILCPRAPEPRPEPERLAA